MPPSAHPQPLDEAQQIRPGARLRALRAAQSLKLEHLATKCGLTRGYLSLVERDLKTPSVAALFHSRQAAAGNYVLHRHRPGQARPGRAKRRPPRSGAAGQDHGTLHHCPSRHRRRAPHPRRRGIAHRRRGKVMVRLGGSELVLGQNDSLYLTASIAHTIRSIGPLQPALLVVPGARTKNLLNSPA